MSKWIAEFELEDGDKMPEHMDLEYHGAKLDFHCRPIEKTYEDGLNEAWEAARKVVCDEAYGWKVLDDIFGTSSINLILSLDIASEVIEKIKKYEETNVEIKLGDEVESCGAIGVVVESPYDDAYDNEVLVLWANSAVVAYKKQDLKKTGRHFPQIEEIIMQMQESRE